MPRTQPRRMLRETVRPQKGWIPCAMGEANLPLLLPPCHVPTPAIWGGGCFFRVLGHAGLGACALPAGTFTALVARWRERIAFSRTGVTRRPAFLCKERRWRKAGRFKTGHGQIHIKESRPHEKEDLADSGIGPCCCRPHAYLRLRKGRRYLKMLPGTTTLRRAATVGAGRSFRRQVLPGGRRVVQGFERQWHTGWL